MESSIIQWLNRDKATIDRVIEDTFFRLLESTGALDPYMPFQNYDDFDIAIAKIRRNMPIASIIGPDSSLPVRKPSAQLEITEHGALTLAAAYYYNREDLKLFHKLEMALASAAPNAQSLVDYFRQTSADLVPQLVRTHTLLTIQAITSAIVNYTDPLTDVEVDLTYPTEAGQFNTLAGGNAWTLANRATANGLSDIETQILQLFFDRNGFYPSAIAMKTATLRELAQQDSTKAAVLDLRGVQVLDTSTLGAVRPPTVSELGQILAQRTNAISGDAQSAASITIQLIDAKYDEEDKGGGFTRKDFWPDNQVTALTEGMAERAFVPVAENDFAGGVFTENRTVETVPRRDRSAAIAGGIPVVIDTDFLQGLKVA